MRVALVLLVLLLLAGCGGPRGEPKVVAEPVDGAAALAFVQGLVTDATGGPRFRVPGTDGHATGAAFLWGALQVPGWTAQWQNFTGAQYIAMDKGEVGTYYQSNQCSTDERTRLATLAFHNLWAVHDEPGTGQLVLLGAHWESKRFANQDADVAKRGQPVLGANDGASGVGLLLQLMREVHEQDLDLPFDLGVAFFDGEDGFEDCHPLAGSLHFVTQLDAGQVDRFLLLDMVGDPTARFVVESASRDCDPALSSLVQSHGAGGPLAANFPGAVKEVTDDHVPFLEAGIPSLDLIDYGRPDTRFGFPPVWHTTDDTLAHLDATMLGHVGDLLLAVLLDHAFVDDWPATCA